MPRQSKTLAAEDLGKGFQAESVRRHSAGLPSRDLNENPLDHGLSGRMERRLPIIVVVCLALCEPADDAREERTFTDNISLHGARLFSGRAWQPGDGVQVTQRNQDAACGKVVYCQKLPDDRYGIGVKFQDRPMNWSSLERYDGLIL